ncbi:MAG: hypothetical protein V1768_01830 [Patescibacteria group bacterium]|nr:hypothetical protein [Patescibacteria group bacterium]MBU1160721.1 hypothetical protein [Patescibacteria group bacterium]MBU1349781.1 hypothetical protein [Patescibacteria group bacterium]MBU1421514.1 hypothetical protein [Patescibacteria group bacterium]MBU2415604.1 hypothetical protein [Patescibacteria group bacterium]
MTLIIKKLIYTELFYLFTGALIIFAGLEILWPNIILAYININYTLLLWMISGIAVLLIE